MAIVCIDFETTYTKEYSLSKMSDVEYVLDPRFQTIMCAIKVGRAPTETFVGHNAVAQRLNAIEWRTTALLAHKVSFDGSILAWHYGHVPALYLDTLSMARATTHWHTGSSSLKRVSEYLDLPPKGDEVVKAQGKRLEDFSPDELAAYRAYCARDNENAREIFDLLRHAFLDTELRLIDLVARMFILPQVMLDAGVLHEHLIDVQERKAAIMQQVVERTDPSVFSSNAKFAVLLREHGVEVPMKRSPTTGEKIPALARGDWAFKELCADENQSLEVQALLAARIAAKSTLEETRTANLLRLSEIDWPRQGRGWAPVPLKYSGARTHRLSGDGGLNWQNFQRGSRIRAAVTAPAGYRIIHRDASQIEARMVAWLAGCETLLQAFAEGRDVYSEFASIVYDRPITRDDKLERFVGKTCLAAGTQVLTPRGAVCIENVTSTDLVWDGIEWVSHAGLIAQGRRETLTLSGVSLTPDHRVWCGDQYREASAAGKNGRFHPSVIAAASLPSPDMCSAPRAAESSLYWSDAIAAYQNIQLTATISKISRALAAMLARNKLRRRSDTGAMPKQCRTMRTARGCLTGWLRRLRGAITQHLETINTTVYAAFRSLKNGATTGLPFYATSRLSAAGTIQNGIWTASTTTRDMNLGTYDSLRRQLTWQTNATSSISRPSSESWKPVFDLANAGPRQRFTILSSDGPVIVSNCVLGLGYGCGAVKFRHMLFIGNGGQSIQVAEDFARNTVFLYREVYCEIPALWQLVGYLLSKLTGKPRTDRVGWEQQLPRLPVTPAAQALYLPSGLPLAYPEIRWFRDPATGREELCYTDQYQQPRRIYGAMGVENISQGLARIVVTDIAVAIKAETGYAPFLSTHDSLDYCVPASEAEALDAALEDAFAVPPVWAAGLPLASEGGWGRTLLDAEKAVNQ